MDTYISVPQELVELWPRVASQLSERLATQLAVLQQRMASACAAASAEGQEAKLKAAMGEPVGSPVWVTYNNLTRKIP